MKQMRHPGAMLSFELKKGLQGGIDFMNKLKMCVRTVSLGTCDTLAFTPCFHDPLQCTERRKREIWDYRWIDTDECGN